MQLGFRFRVFGSDPNRFRTAFWGRWAGFRLDAARSERRRRRRIRGMEAAETSCEARARPPARSENERYDAQPGSSSHPIPVHHNALVSDLAKPGRSGHGCPLLLIRSGRTARITLPTTNRTEHPSEPGQRFPDLAKPGRALRRRRQAGRKRRDGVVGANNHRRTRQAGPINTADGRDTGEVTAASSLA